MQVIIYLYVNDGVMEVERYHCFTLKMRDDSHEERIMIMASSSITASTTLVAIILDESRRFVF